MAAGDSRRTGAHDGELPPLLRHGGRALAATVAGREGAARRHYDSALAAGVPAVALVEIARMAHLLGGFPRAIQGLKALGDALAARRLAPPRDPEPARRARPSDRARGLRLFRRIYGPSSRAVLARLDAVAPGFSGWVVEDAYGRVLARPGLAARERELLTVAALAALRCPLQLESHVRGALRLGATPREVTAMVRAIGHDPTRAASSESRAILRSTRAPR